MVSQTVWYQVDKAVQKGFLVKPDICSDCGRGDKSLHGHHKDYAKPLEVIWLCPSCHMKLHHKAKGYAFYGDTPSTMRIRGKTLSLPVFHESPFEKQGLLVDNTVFDRKRDASNTDFDKLFQDLTHRQKRVIYLSFGFNGKDCESLEVISKKLRVTKQRIYQIRVQALNIIRESIKNK